MHEPPPPFLIVFGILLVVGIVALARWWYSTAQQVKRALRKTPRTNVRDARDGDLVKIVGQLRYLHEPVIAPISGRRCAYFEARVERKHGKNSWVEVAREVGGAEFLVEDSTGRAVVDPVLVETAVVEDSTGRSGFLNDPSDRLASFLARHDVASTTLLGFNRTMRYREGVFEEGETVAVLGVAVAESDPEGGIPAGSYRSGPRRLRIGPRVDGPVLMTDDKSVTELGS